MSRLRSSLRIKIILISLAFIEFKKFFTTKPWIISKLIIKSHIIDLKQFMMNLIKRKHSMRHSCINYVKIVKDIKKFIK